MQKEGNKNMKYNHEIWTDDSLMSDEGELTNTQKAR